MKVYEIAEYQVGETPRFRRIEASYRRAVTIRKERRRAARRAGENVTIYISEQIWPDTRRGAIALANNAPKGVMISTKVR